jgi:hypothetical protein
MDGASSGIDEDRLAAASTGTGNGDDGVTDVDTPVTSFDRLSIWQYQHATQAEPNTTNRRKYKLQPELNAVQHNVER